MGKVFFGSSSVVSLATDCDGLFSSREKQRCQVDHAFHLKG